MSLLSEVLGSKKTTHKGDAFKLNERSLNHVSAGFNLGRSSEVRMYLNPEYQKKNCQL